jgi:hypothetical protein
MYGIENAIDIDIPVRTWEYQNKVEKISKRCIFTSMPDRGLIPLSMAWPRIVAQVPDATLAITSDWRLWDCNIGDGPVRPYRLMFAGLPNVSYYGAVKRNELVQRQLEAELHLYPCVYEELFCISVAESQVAGIFPITSDAGALRTTNMGRILAGNPMDGAWQDNFVSQAVTLLNDPTLFAKRNQLTKWANKRFSIQKVMEQWQDKVFANA